ncbi:DUF6514 family protein [Clostridium magnum]|uniref:Uncharacterized protein n=1 Tax=Clostridium magnum DSM 2767 TaxID=1121326 RepID=A0A162TZT1_9CLOT|nr:DUF6514 family protein [Clostridium magnum]KZL93265.1 hypothetical protein CLMAG_02880 [Clostridium magnum DSM 2767]SHI19094.1 hypothetical protein SAMN02745944_03057 [Clostridium magnum DSM 2767]
MVVENLVRTENVEKIRYNYFYRLLKGKISIPCEIDAIEVQSYGIEIERQDILNGELVNIERDCVENISPDRNKVHNLLQLLYDHAVSPIHLIEVLGEYIDEYIIDFDRELSCMA